MRPLFPPLSFGQFAKPLLPKFDKEMYMSQTSTDTQTPVLQTLPGDEIRQILWRYQDRFDYQMLVQSTRSVARGPVARLVAQGARNSHDWTEEKNSLLRVYDDSGITGAFLPPEYGGLFEGPKNLIMSLVAFELAWVDGGAATASLAGNLGAGPHPRVRHPRASGQVYEDGRAGQTGREP